MLKKIMSLLLIIAVSISLVACNRENRFVFSELLKRIGKELPDVEVNMEDAFFSDGEWFLFLSVSEENDIIITASEDESNKYLTSVAVSSVNMGLEGQVEQYIKVCEAAADAFIFGIDAKKALESTGFYTENIIFSDEVRFFEEGRFKLSFFNADIGSTLLMEMVY